MAAKALMNRLVALDTFVALHTCAAGSKFVLPSRYDPNRCMSHATLNRVAQLIAARGKAAGLPPEPFTVHDLRRTGATLLNDVGFNGDWIEKCVAHEEGCSSRSVHNKAEYAEQRRHMLQDRADMVDAWIDGRTHVPKLQPENVGGACIECGAVTDGRGRKRSWFLSWGVSRAWRMLQTSSKLFLSNSDDF